MGMPHVWGNPTRAASARNLPVRGVGSGALATLEPNSLPPDAPAWPGVFLAFGARAFRGPATIPPHSTPRPSLHAELPSSRGARCGVGVGA